MAQCRVRAFRMDTSGSRQTRGAVAILATISGGGGSVWAKDVVLWRYVRPVVELGDLEGSVILLCDCTNLFFPFLIFNK